MVVRPRCRLCGRLGGGRLGVLRALRVIVALADDRKVLDRGKPAGLPLGFHRRLWIEAGSRAAACRMWLGERSQGVSTDMRWGILEHRSFVARPWCRLLLGVRLLVSVGASRIGL